MVYFSSYFSIANFKSFIKLLTDFSLFLTQIITDTPRTFLVKLEDLDFINRPTIKKNIVIKLGNTDITDMMSYMKGLSKIKKGDKVMVKFKRNNKIL